ncbi:MAG: hypothetical protein FWD77_06130 [Betaproteobacteria bacterium]|nr:hypothetical protein [Betaproteobacteria bacterium]
MNRTSDTTRDLEQMALDEIAKRRRSGADVTALVFGSNAHEQAHHMAAAGARVVLGDDAEDPLPVGVGYRVPLRDIWSALEDPAAINKELPAQPYDLIICQHVLHPLRYEEARLAVRSLLQRQKIGGKLFVSVYGIHSELGDVYPDSEKLIADRYAPLPKAVAKRYGIDGPICLYSARNLFSLLFEVGAAVLYTSTSTLGTLRAVAVRV